MWRRYQIPLLLSLLLLLIVGFVLVRPGMRPEELVGAQSSTSLSCEVFCSDTRIGVSVAELTFSGDAGSLSQLALEVTVYKNGFAIGRLARVSPIRGGQKFEVIRPPGEVGSAPGFDTLALTAVRFQTDRGLVTARVEGLDAGLNYFWRVRPAGGSGTLTETTVCQAPDCPVDSEPPQVPGPR
jgi:hypothetical protein